MSTEDLTIKRRPLLQFENMNGGTLILPASARVLLINSRKVGEEPMHTYLHVLLYTYGGGKDGRTALTETLAIKGSAQEALETIHAWRAEHDAVTIHNELVTKLAHERAEAEREALEAKERPLRREREQIHTRVGMPEGRVVPTVFAHDEEWG